MSLVTRCTSCGTLFKVVADQLKISEGWVRCGQCANVFDAQANLVQAPPLTPQGVAAQEAQPTEAFTSQVSLPSAALEQDSVRDSAFDTKDRDALVAAFASANVSISLPKENEVFLKPSKTVTSETISIDEPPHHAPSSLDSQSFRPGKLRNDDDLQSDAGPSTSGWAPSSSAISADAEPTSLEPQATPQFVQQAQRAARWRKPWMRFGLALLALALMAGLALQIALQEKDRIAAQWPQTQPWLEQLCQQARCQVEPLKRIETIAVDASSFNRISKNNDPLEAITQSYRLALTLKNNGALPVAMPHVELSLQDAQDQPILRRVLSPADLGSSLLALAPAQDMQGSLTLQIDTSQLANRRIQGYRVLAFYP